MVGRWVGEGEKVTAGRSRALGNREGVLGQIIDVGIRAGILG